MPYICCVVFQADSTLSLSSSILPEKANTLFTWYSQQWTGNSCLNLIQFISSITIFVHFTSNTCSRLHVQDFMFKTSCSRLHVQDFMFKTSCSRLHVHDFMFKTSCSRLHVALRCPCSIS